MGPLWGIYEDHGFRDDLYRLVPDAITRDDLVHSAYYAVARDPMCGKYLTRGLWWIAAGPLPGGQSVALVYTFDDQNVTMHQVWERVTE